MTKNDIFDFNLPTLKRFLKSDFKGAFCLSNLNSPLKLGILNYILADKKILLITSDEQTALKYQKDFESLFKKEVKIFPFSI